MTDRFVIHFSRNPIPDTDLKFKMIIILEFQP